MSQLRGVALIWEHSQKQLRGEYDKLKAQRVSGGSSGSKSRILSDLPATNPPAGCPLSVWLQCCAATRCCIPKVEKCVFQTGTVKVAPDGVLTISGECGEKATFSYPSNGGKLLVYYKVCVIEDKCKVCYMADVVVKNTSGSDVIVNKIELDPVLKDCNSAVVNFVNPPSPGKTLGGGAQLCQTLSGCCEDCGAVEKVNLQAKVTYNNTEKVNSAVNCVKICTDCKNCLNEYQLKDCVSTGEVTAVKIWRLENGKYHLKLQYNKLSQFTDVKIGDCFIYQVEIDIPDGTAEKCIVNKVKLFIKGQEEAIIDEDTATVCVEPCQPTITIDTQVKCDNSFCFCIDDEDCEQDHPTENGCTLTLGGWKKACGEDHPTIPSISSILDLFNEWSCDKGEKNGLLLGNICYDKEDICCILKKSSSGGNCYIILAHQLIPAILNIIRGVAHSKEVDDAITAALALLNNINLLATPVCANANAKTLAEFLDKYNNGLLGPPHCGCDNQSPRTPRTPRVHNEEVSPLTEPQTETPKFCDCVDFTLSTCNESQSSELCVTATSEFKCWKCECDDDYSLEIRLVQGNVDNPGCATGELLGKTTDDYGTGEGKCLKRFLKLCTKTAPNDGGKGTAFGVIRYKQKKYNSLTGECENYQGSTEICSNINRDPTDYDLNLCTPCTACVKVDLDFPSCCQGKLYVVIDTENTHEGIALLQNQFGLGLGDKPLEGLYKPPPQLACQKDVDLSKIFPLKYKVKIPCCDSPPQKPTVVTKLTVKIDCGGICKTYNSSLEVPVEIVNCTSANLKSFDRVAKLVSTQAVAPKEVPPTNPGCGCNKPPPQNPPTSPPVKNDDTPVSAPVSAPVVQGFQFIIPAKYRGKPLPTTFTLPTRPVAKTSKTSTTPGCGCGKPPRK